MPAGSRDRGRDGLGYEQGLVLGDAEFGDASHVVLLVPPDRRLDVTSGPTCRRFVFFGLERITVEVPVVLCGTYYSSWGSGLALYYVLYVLYYILYYIVFCIVFLDVIYVFSVFIPDQNTQCILCIYRAQERGLGQSPSGVRGSAPL